MQYAENMKVLNHMANLFYAASNQGEVASFPEHITLMPLFRCNYQCRMCHEWTRGDQPDMPREVLDKIIEALPFVRTLFVTGGEPLMYRHIEDLFRKGREAGCNLWIVTNGSLMDERRRAMLIEHRLDQVKISLDAATPKTYEFVRGGNFMKVLTNIALLAQLKVRHGLTAPRIQLGFVAMKRNIGELGKLVAMAKEVGVDHIYVTYCGIQSEDMVPESLYLHQEYSDEQMMKAAEIARRVDMPLELPPLFNPDAGSDAARQCNRVAESCHEPWKHLFIRPDGTCKLCCGGGGACGNLAESSFSEVWNHPARAAARRKVNTPAPPAACLNCQTVKQNPNRLDTHIAPKHLQEMALALMGAKHPEPVAKAS